MLIDPPIDKLIGEVGCKYALVCLVAQRARFLEDKKAEMLAQADKNAISYASQEVYEGKVELAYEG
ncbi:MAG: DNA-directed RNA polymerase subunit omega [Clostridiales bacterium]|nr:DNA-directed RNA polymerase subunit omega [Clostridiales bacterium]